MSAELFGHYKRDREVYEGAARLLGLAPGQVMMVAAHKDDLDAAASTGLRTAFVARPMERGDPAKADVAPSRGSTSTRRTSWTSREQLGC